MRRLALLPVLPAVSGLLMFGYAGPDSSAGNTYLLVAESSMVKVLPDVPLGDGPHRETLEFAVAGGEVKAGQIVIKPGTEPLRDVEFSVSALKGPDGSVLSGSAVTLSVMGYVQTDPEAKLAFPVERSGWFPDPILPFVERFDVQEGKVQSLWLSVTCPPGQRAGVYSGRVTVSPANAEEQTMPVEVRVFGFDVPKKRSLPTATATFMDHPERIHGDAWNREMYWRYVDFLHAHRINMNNIYRTGEDPPTVDDVKRLVAGGQDSWCLRFVRQPAKFGNERGGDPETFDEYVSTAIAEAKAAYEVFVEAGAEDLCYIYLFDEVREEYYDLLKETATRVREALPGVPLVTSAFDLDYGIESGVADVIDRWGAIIFAFTTDEYLANIEKARANGVKVSWYVAIWPPNPFPNFYVEYDAIELRLLMGAMTQKYRPDGFGYWATTWWGNNDDPITKGPYTDWNPFTGASNGDGSLFCPGPDGPLTTIRFENFRDGLEDYEYYRLLEKAIAAGRERGVSESQLASAEALLTVPEEIVKALDDYTRDALLLERHRLRVAEAIEGLTPKSLVPTGEGQTSGAASPARAAEPDNAVPTVVGDRLSNHALQYISSSPEADHRSFRSRTGECGLDVAPPTARSSNGNSA
ncbi:MAG: DUF4091 domain-containing protein [Armatimonadetes bacterium]|nr:DUF4091 domain-containing protein [Armatimonadota bacterium]